MELRHLRYFLVLAEELHFARAADRLGIDQSPLSRQIRQLETELKVRLFERTRRSTTLTAVGEELVQHARRILADTESTVRSVRLFASRRHPLRLGVAEFSSATPLQSLLLGCREADPSLDVLLSEAPYADLMYLLSTGGLDAVLAPVPATGREFRNQTAWSEELVLLTEARTGGAASETAIATYAGEKWILPHPGMLPCTASQIQLLLARSRVAQANDMTFVSTSALASLVATGAGVALLPKSMAEHLSGVRIRRLRDRVTLKTWLTTRNASTASHVEAFCALVRATTQVSI